MQKLATSECAKQKLSELKPFSNINDALNSFSQITECLELLLISPRPFMESLDLFSLWIERIKKQAVLKPLEIKDVRNFCLEIYATHEVLQKCKTPWLNQLKKNLMNAQRPLSAIDQILTLRGEIRNDASERLYNLFNEREQLERQIRSTLDKLVKDHDMESYLQDKYMTTREGRWVLPIRSGQQHFVKGIIHASSQTKQTVFIEPENLVPQNNRQRQIDLEIEEEIERLLTELSNFLSSLKIDFLQSREILEALDIKLAQAGFAQKIEAQTVIFDSKKIDLKNVKHPLLILSGQNVIANTVQLNPQHSVLLLSGPNAGGKTVLLKSIGLACHMARCGLLIAADQGSSLPFFKEMIIGIGDAQSVDENLSTFAAHLKILSEATHLKGPDNLILLDEICGSTDPEEGSALARSFIETYASNGVYTVVTSHLGPLKLGWKEDSHVVNGSLEYDSHTGRPTYQFIHGVPGESLALQTARRVGVSTKILDQALNFLSPASRARQEGLEEIEQLKQDIQKYRNQLISERKEAEKSKKKYDQLIAEFEKEKSQILTKSVKQAERKLDELVSNTKVQEVFKRHGALQEIKSQLPEVVKLTPNNSVNQSPSIKSAEDFSSRFPPGSKVYISTLGQDGLIQSSPNSKGEVLVLSNSLRLQLHWQDLKPPQKNENPTAQIARKSGSFLIPSNDGDRVLDLRGKSAEEAISQLEITLDQASQQQEDRIKVIHGFGTEVLKKAVRSYLSRSMYVKKWKAGAADSGGDGITWVELIQ